MKQGKNSPTDTVAKIGDGKSPMQTPQTQVSASLDAVQTEKPSLPLAEKAHQIYTQAGLPSSKIGVENTQTVANVSGIRVSTLVSMFDWTVRLLEKGGYLTVCNSANEYQVCLQKPKWLFENGFKLQVVAKQEVR